MPDAVLGAIAARRRPRRSAPCATARSSHWMPHDGHLLWQASISGKSPVLSRRAVGGPMGVRRQPGRVPRRDRCRIRRRSSRRVPLNDRGKPGQDGLCLSSPPIAGGCVYVGSETGGLRCFIGTGQRTARVRDHAAMTALAFCRIWPTAAKSARRHEGRQPRPPDPRRLPRARRVRRHHRRIPLGPRAPPTDRRTRRTSIPAELADAIRRRLPRAWARPPVAVRSSATAEDMAGASMAGQYDTFLDITDEDGLLDAVRCCWASLDSPRTRTYFAEHGIDVNQVAMAVVVQTAGAGGRGRRALHRQPAVRHAPRNARRGELGPGRVGRLRTRAARRAAHRPADRPRARSRASPTSRSSSRPAAHEERPVEERAAQICRACDRRRRASCGSSACARPTTSARRRTWNGPFTAASCSCSRPARSRRWKRPRRTRRCSAPSPLGAARAARRRPRAVGGAQPGRNAAAPDAAHLERDAAVHVRGRRVRRDVRGLRVRAVARGRHGRIPGAHRRQDLHGPGPGPEMFFERLPVPLRPGGAATTTPTPPTPADHSHRLGAGPAAATGRKVGATAGKLRDDVGRPRRGAARPDRSRVRRRGAEAEKRANWARSRRRRADRDCGASASGASWTSSRRSRCCRASSAAWRWPNCRRCSTSTSGTRSRASWPSCSPPAGRPTAPCSPTPSCTRSRRARARRATGSADHGHRARRRIRPGHARAGASSRDEVADRWLALQAAAPTRSPGTASMSRTSRGDGCGAASARLPADAAELEPPERVELVRRYVVFREDGKDYLMLGYALLRERPWRRAGGWRSATTSSSSPKKTCSTHCASASPRCT